MLAKMGWNKGNGLGKQQNGSLDFIQVRYKNNANGLGYDGLKDNQWTENESQFDNLLKSLVGTQDSNSCNAEEEQPAVVKSLEEKSKLSRARVHYKKFTRGKDVHRYSEKELANILGKKTLKETEPKPEEVVEIEEDSPSVYDSNLIVNTGLSVTDYFKQKMQAKFQPATDGLSDESKTTREKKKKQKDSEEKIDDIQEEEIAQPKSSKKKKKRTPSQEEVVENLLIETEDQPKRKKKSKRLLEDDTKAAEVDDTQLDLEPKKKSKCHAEPAQEEDKPTKSKKNSKKETSTVPETSSTVKAPPKRTGELDRPAGANAVYSTNIIQIPSHVAQKMSNMTVDKFKNSNIANIVGYGLSEDIEMKIVQTKIGDNSFNTDKYSLYNMDRLTTRQKVNPRKIISKIKRTKKSIQVI